MGEWGFECRALDANPRLFVPLAPGDVSVKGEAELVESPEPGEGRSVPRYFSTPSPEPACSLEPPGADLVWGRE